MSYERTFRIMGRYKNQDSEVIDEFDTREEADEMLAEYKLAYGSDFTLWIESN